LTGFGKVFANLISKWSQSKIQKSISHGKEKVRKSLSGKQRINFSADSPGY